MKGPNKAPRDEAKKKINQGRKVKKRKSEHALRKDQEPKSIKKTSMGDILKKYKFCTSRSSRSVPVGLKSELVLYDPELDALFNDSMALGENMAEDIRVLARVLSQTSDPLVAPDSKIVVSNVVSTFLLGCKVDLQRMAKLGVNVLFEPKKFPGLRMALRSPKSTALIFANGKVICMGAKSTVLSKKAARRFARIVMKLGHDRAGLHQFRICNMVATCYLDARIDLARLYQCEKLKSPAGHIGYDIEQFPGLSYPVVGTNLKLNVFHTGTIVILGGLHEDEIYKAIRDSYSTIMSYSVHNEQLYPKP